ncbi:transglycosylase domain-containing protein [Methylosoma difficile]
MARRLKSKHSLQRMLTIYIVVVGLLVSGIFVYVVHQEVETSKYQARYLSQISKQLSYKLTSGSSSSVRYPEFGPYDERLGYTLLPDAIKRLEDSGYAITSQATFSPKMTEMVDYGLFAIYHEKNQAGLRIVDQADKLVFKALYPEHGYPSFDTIPPVVLKTLLFIENRELFDEKKTYVNPAVEWDRLGFASLQLVANKLGVGGNVPGGSTLATQIEKYRHSPDGYTRSVVDKFRQMGSASIRAYLQGPDTRAMRREIALAYLNSMPLAAAPKVGEVHGLGDGLSAWFGADFNEVNRLLSPQALSARQITEQQGQAYRQVLSVLLSQRRPSYLLGKGYDSLQKLTESHLRILAEQGVIPLGLRNAALKASSVRPPRAAAVPSKFANERKTQMVLRSRLGKALGVKSNYELDRLDLTVKTTIDYNTQQAVTSALRRLSDPANARAAGLLGKRMLDDNSKLDPIVYSLMLFERSPTGNLLRVQTDNYDQPLDINEGIRIDLGSTAKLRTMVHYLELLAGIYEQYKGYSLAQLNQIDVHPRDHLTLWMVEQLKANPKVSLEHLMMMALERRYSASPGEAFFTGGGLHTFSNFTKDENGRIMSIREALRDSVNLVFIRLMRDVVYHHLYKPNGVARWLDSPDDPKREEYLQRFADNEGREYLKRFYSRYRNKSPEEALDLLTQRVLAKASRLTMLYRAVYPDKDENALQAYLNNYLSKDALVEEDLYSLYDKYSVDKFDLQDQGYITKVHPLELWLVSYWVKHPKASFDELVEASTEQRQQVYRWLLKSNKKNAQQRRILTLLETEAFRDIHHAWERVGYPFGGLTSSYATSIGASGDRPAALAELVGILRNDGLRMPAVRFEYLHFAKGTPYETVMSKLPEQGERIFAPEVARAARSAMAGVVQGGTASRLSGVYVDANGKAMEVGGKTGTGDHRKEVWGPGGRLIESKFISRAAVFTFFLGEQYFGVITAYVTGDDAGLYHFTSSLPVQILKSLKPTLTPLLNKTSTEPVGEPKPLPASGLQTVSSGLPIPVVVKAAGTQPLAKLLPSVPVAKVTKPIAKPVVKPLLANSAIKETKALPVPVRVPAAPKPKLDTKPVGVIKPELKTPVQNAVKTVKPQTMTTKPTAVVPPNANKPSAVANPNATPKPVAVPNLTETVKPVPPAKPITPLAPVAKPAKPAVNTVPKTPTTQNKPITPASSPTAPTAAAKPKPVAKPVSSATTPPPVAKPKSDDKQNSATRYFKYPTPATPVPAPAPAVQ